MVAGVGDDSLRPANPYKHWPEPHFKRILNKTKRKSPGKTLQSREFQRVLRVVLTIRRAPNLILGFCGGWVSRLNPKGTMLLG